MHWEEDESYSATSSAAQNIWTTQPETLSGEKQRVALARARILRPRLLLLDEPTSNLDGPAREQVIALIPSFLDQGSSILIACHDRDLTNMRSVQRWKLRDGRIELRRGRALLRRIA